MGLAAMLGLCLHADAAPRASTFDDTSLQVFSKLSRAVLAVGATFSFEVEVYASPSSAEAAAGVERAFMAASYSPKETGLELVREESRVSGFEEKADRPLVLVRRFILRTRRAGPHRVPSFQFRYGRHTHTAPERQVMVYEVDPDFMKAGKSILPILAERSRTVRRQPGYVRVGSAFLIAPDALVTNLHVVMDARRVWVTLPDGKRLAVRKGWVIDPVRDVAVLYVDPKVMAEAGLTPLRLAPEATTVTTEAPHDGDEAIAFTYGWPGGVQRSTAGLRYPGLTLQPGETLWITANPVRPGDSGGPLLDRHGRVLGAVSAGTVGSNRPEALRQEVCIAVDIRPALGHKLLMKRPRSLRTLMRAPAFETHPHMQALRLSTLLATGRRPPGFSASLAQLDAALEQESENARLHFLRGVIHQMLGKRHRAADSYRASLDAFDGNFLSSYMLAQHHLHRNEYAEAERLYRHTLQYQPYAYFAAYGLARALMGRLRYEEAAELLRSVIAHDPTYAPAYYNLALCALARDDEPGAHHLLAKLDGLSPIRARQLRRVLRNPLFRPRVLQELPRAAIPLLPASN